MNAYLEGYNAWTLGIDQNPYDLLTEEWSEWDKGWEDAETDFLMDL